MGVGIGGIGADVGGVVHLQRTYSNIPQSAAAAKFMDWIIQAAASIF